MIAIAFTNTTFSFEFGHSIVYYFKRLCFFSFVLGFFFVENINMCDVFFVFIASCY